MSYLSAAEAPGSRPWNETGELDAQGMETWVRGRLELQHNLIEELLAVDSSRTLENTLRPYDDAVALLSATGSLASLLDSVYPDKAVRDKCDVRWWLRRAVSCRTPDEGSM